MSNPTTPPRTVIARDGDTVDQLCWRHQGQTAAVTEATLALNPGLSDRPHLTAGQRVTLAPPVANTQKLIHLFD